MRFGCSGINIENCIPKDDILLSPGGLLRSELEKVKAVSFLLYFLSLKYFSLSLH